MRLSSIDHDWFVAMKMPSFVSPMISASEPSRGSREMFVMRISGRCAQPSARIVPLERLADDRRRLAAGEEVLEDAVDR